MSFIDQLKFFHHNLNCYNNKFAIGLQHDNSFKYNNLSEQEKAIISFYTLYFFEHEQYMHILNVHVAWIPLIEFWFSPVNTKRQAANDCITSPPDVRGRVKILYLV